MASNKSAPTTATGTTRPGPDTRMTNDGPANAPITNSEWNTRNTLTPEDREAATKQAEETAKAKHEVVVTYGKQMILASLAPDTDKSKGDAAIGKFKGLVEKSMKDALGSEGWHLKWEDSDDDAPLSVMVDGVGASRSDNTIARIVHESVNDTINAEAYK